MPSNGQNLCQLHMLSLLQGLHFMESFRKKGRFSELMGRIPIHVITTRAGAATYGLEIFNAESSKVAA